MSNIEPPSSQDLDRVRVDNERLTNQLQLLVKTEQRLYRSQNELEHQLACIRTLGRFTVETSIDERPDAILERAIRVVTELFLVDFVAALRFQDGRATVVRSLHASLACAVADRAPPLADVRGWEARRDPALLSTDSTDPVAPALRRLVDTLGGDTPSEGADGNLAWIPLGVGGRVWGALVVFAHHRRRAAYKHDTLDGRSLPFLALVGTHVQRALENSLLTQSLRERTEQLAEANARLAASVKQLERAQQELVQVRKMEAIGRLAGGVAHDFNNLLTVVISHVALVEDVSTDPAIRADLASAIDAARRAASITRQMLAFGRQQVLSAKRLDLNGFLGSMLAMLKRLIKSQVDLKLDLDPLLAPPSVFVDQGQLEQVVLNLILNARDALGEKGGTVRVSTRSATAADVARFPGVLAADFVALDVADDGPGIDAETLARIFEPFFSTKSFEHGSGMGLAVVYGIVTQSNGFVFVESEVGRGSTFTVLLPREGSSPDSERARRRSTPLDTTVLLVEDEEPIRKVAGRILRGAGHTVLEARNGVEALEIVRTHPSPIHVVVSDMIMPKMGGRDLAAKLQAHDPPVPVILMSGYADGMEGKAEGEKWAFLAKPFSADGLVDAVAKAVRSR
ncbi:MAG: response regulator [Deltaproteobacteria bacterium]|nr:response regulator [Deltaproteobacteria bacterium]